MRRSTWCAAMPLEASPTLFVTTGDLDHVYPLPFRPHFRQSLSAIAMLRSNRYDIAVDLRGDLRSVLLAWMAQVPTRYGISYSGFDFLLAETIQRGLLIKWKR